MKNALTPLFLFHISVGTIALVSGAAALFFKKGSHAHRIAGKVFVASMFCLTTTGIYLAFKKPAMISVVTGGLTLYLVATAWMTVIRKAGETGRFEIAALCFALAIAGGGLALGLEAANSELGYTLIDGFGIPPSFYYFVAAIAAFCAALDTRMIYRGGIAGSHRIARHLWRMSFALYITNASIFLGNPQIFPESIRGTLFLAAPVIAVFVTMVFWMIRVLFTNWYKHARPT